MSDNRHRTVAVCSPSPGIYIGQPLNIFEMGSKELVWESTGSHIINQTSNPEQSVLRINDLVQQTLRDFPSGV